MKTAIAALLLTASLAGCESQAHKDKLAEDERQFKETAQRGYADLQWKLDDTTAAGLFDDGTQRGLNNYLTFRKCHDEPPAQERNKKVCAALQKRVSDAEAKADAQQAREKAAW